MWYNFIKIAQRKLWNNKWNTFTKLFSLSIGIVSLFFIAIYVNAELGYDAFHTKKEEIFRINTSVVSPTGDLSLGLTAIPVGPYVKSNSPLVKEFVRINKEYGSHAIKAGDKLFSESENIYYSDPSFFKLFDFKMISGNKATALNGPDKIILTENTALKYFGTKDVLDKVLLYDGVPFTISGIIQNIPANSHLQFDFLVSMDTFIKSRPDAAQNWEWFPMSTYILLGRNVNSDNIQVQLKHISQYQEKSASNDQYVLSMEPLKGIHFSTPKLGELGPKGKLSNLYVLLAIGIMILLLALSNFINLTTAQISMQRKEVSVKKAIGASKKDLFRQFFVESILLTSLATIISLFIILLSFSNFEGFMGGTFDISFLVHPSLFLTIPVVPLALSLLGGIYPAIKFANIPGIHMPNSNGKKNRLLTTRTALLVFQFSITSVLVICSLIIFYQLKFIQNRDLGMKISQKIVLDYGPNSSIGTSFEALKGELGAIVGVESVTFSSHVPGQIPNGAATQILDINGRSSNGEINLNLVDNNFIKDYGLQIVAGRDFRPGEADITSTLILNEAAVRAFGYENPEDIIGASFEQWGGNGQVIGVVRDFNYMSLHEDIGLLSLKIWPEQFMKITLQISESYIKETLEDIESKWTSLYPTIPFNYYYVDDNFKAQYDKDKQFSAIINLFTAISICIGILGLIAFATFWCERRRKEMSIRKILGANDLLLVWKLYKGFSIPVLLGFASAIPVSYYLGHQWLEGFAYRFDLNWYFFVAPLIILLVFVWLAVGTQTIKLVFANPVDNLTEE